MSRKKQTIPKTLKNKVWDTWIGRQYGLGGCFCCSKTIDSKDFECGHVQAEAKGGKLSINNLRPICGVCNRSMGTENMNKFMKRTGFYNYFYWLPSFWNMILILLFVMVCLDFYYYQFMFVRQFGYSFKIATQKAICN